MAASDPKRPITNCGANVGYWIVKRSLRLGDRLCCQGRIVHTACLSPLASKPALWAPTMSMQFEPLERKLFCELVVQTVLSLLEADYREVTLSETKGSYAGGHADHSDIQKVGAILEHCQVIDANLRLRITVPAIYDHLAEEPERFGIDLPWMIEALLRPTWDYQPNDSPWRGGGFSSAGKGFPIQERLRELFLFFEKLGYAEVAGGRAAWTRKMGPPMCGAGGWGIFTPDGIAAYDEVVRMAQTLPSEFHADFLSKPTIYETNACWVVANHWYRNEWHAAGALGDRDKIPFVDGDLFLGSHERAHRMKQFLRGEFPSRQDVLTGAYMAANRK